MTAGTIVLDEATIIIRACEVGHVHFVLLGDNDEIISAVFTPDEARAIASAFARAIREAEVAAASVPNTVDSDPRKCTRH